MDPATSGPPPPLRRNERLDPSVFQLPADRMRAGYYSDKYFVRTREVLMAEGEAPLVTVLWDDSKSMETRDVATGDSLQSLRYPASRGAE